MATPEEEKLIVPPTEERRPTLAVPVLRSDELKFFATVSSGSVADVRQFLIDHPTLNINCVNYQGLTALHLAVKSELEEMVKFLFTRPDLQLNDIALHAAATGNIPITELILDTLEKRRLGSEFSTYDESPEYSRDVTPLMLAAQNGQYRMVRLLISRNHSIERPHLPSCLCDICKDLIAKSGSNLSRMRLNVYRAICNPAYICQITDDPIFYCFDLDRELKTCSNMDKEFRAEFIELGQELREFTVSLVSNCRNPEEMEIILKQKAGYSGTYRHVEFPRLQVALDYMQKEFVAHSLVQQVLNSFWVGEYTTWHRLSLTDKSVRLILRVLMLPVITAVYIVKPSAFIARKWNAPVNKFVSDLASYLLFVSLAFLLIHLDISRNRRGPPRTGLEVVIIIYVLGFMWSSFKQFWVEGRVRFFRIPWHWYDILMESIFFLTFILWLKSLIDAHSDKAHKRTVLERKFWHSSDATLLHEGFFAIGSILSFGRLMYYCQQSSRLGPLQISLGKMTVQIGYFCVFAFLINFCFAMPMSRLYNYYDGMVQTNEGQTKVQLSSFSTFSNSMVTLFWAMFCMSPVESADVIIENIGGNKTHPVINHHDFTQSVGRMLFGLYELMMVVALLNTLIAVLSNTFQKVVDNVDVEWKFARTKLWMYYFHEATSLPSPYNLIPSPNLIFYVGRYLAVCFNKVPGAKAKFSVARCCYIEYEKEPIDDTAPYQVLMTNLVQRYFRSKQEEVQAG